MATKSLREQSRIDWGHDIDKAITLEQINTGALLRIADAVEKMAQSYDNLIRDRDWQKRQRERAESDLATERRRTAALRGVLKKRAAK